LPHKNRKTNKKGKAENETVMLFKKIPY